MSLQSRHTMYCSSWMLHVALCLMVSGVLSASNLDRNRVVDTLGDGPPLEALKPRSLQTRSIFDIIKGTFHREKHTHKSKVAHKSSSTTAVSTSQTTSSTEAITRATSTETTSTTSTVSTAPETSSSTTAETVSTTVPVADMSDAHHDTAKKTAPRMVSTPRKTVVVSTTIAPEPEMVVSRSNAIVAASDSVSVVETTPAKTTTVSTTVTTQKTVVTTSTIAVPEEDIKEKTVITTPMVAVPTGKPISASKDHGAATEKAAHTLADLDDDDNPNDCGDIWESCTESNCCIEKNFTCHNVTQWYRQCRDRPPLPPIQLAGYMPIRYRLRWAAKGHHFFDHFDFVPGDANHGSAQYVKSVQEAKDNHLIETTKTRAIIRAGGRGEGYKRLTAKIATKKSWKHFLVALKFNYMPWGCGVWPAFYSKGTGLPWPYGGEMDIVEHVNDQGAFTSFHTGQNCSLHTGDVNRFKQMYEMNLKANDWNEYNCHTEYCKDCTSLGCAPNVNPLRTGKDWAEQPGVVAMQRAPEFTKIFFIPEDKIPADLARNKPKPEYWDEFMISYYPFGASKKTCPDPDGVMSPQQFFLSIGFCGDWASKTWGESQDCRKVGPRFNKTATKYSLWVDSWAKHPQCRAVDPLAEYSPDQDCCTQFIADKDGKFDTDPYLANRAYFDIDYLKVFQ